MRAKNRSTRQCSTKIGGNRNRNYNERDGITINSGRLPCLCAGFTVQFREARSPHECLGETLCGFGSRRPHQWNDGAICEAANSAAIDDLGPPNARFVRHNLVKVKDPPPPKPRRSRIELSSRLGAVLVRFSLISNRREVFQGLRRARSRPVRQRTG